MHHTGGASSVIGVALKRRNSHPLLREPLQAYFLSQQRPSVGFLHTSCAVLALTRACTTVSVSACSSAPPRHPVGTGSGPWACLKVFHFCPETPCATAPGCVPASHLNGHQKMRHKFLDLFQKTRTPIAMSAPAPQVIGMLERKAGEDMFRKVVCHLVFQASKQTPEGAMFPIARFFIAQSLCQPRSSPKCRTGHVHIQMPIESTLRGPAAICFRFETHARRRWRLQRYPEGSAAVSNGGAAP